ncbi:MAG: TetR/AcrR family transcriptional regulator [bacterium]|nr:TetR/AcrR family transcriptional regulator [bacterium]
MSEGEQIKPQKERMMARARVLFWEKGYEGTSMKDIAKACGCKPANIYNYFENKETMLYDILKEEMEQIIAPIKGLEQDEETDPLVQLRSLIENHVRLTLSDRRSSKLLFDMELGSLSPVRRKKIISMRDHYDRILRTIIRRGIQAGHFADVDEKMAAYSIASMSVRTRLWYSPKGRLTVDEVIDFIFNFAVNGLRGEK